MAETNGCNLFLVYEGVVVTPNADHCMPGVTRGLVMKLCQTLLSKNQQEGNLVSNNENDSNNKEVNMVKGFEERRVSLSEFYSADEVFMTGTMGELTPVVIIDGRHIGSAHDRSSSSDDNDSNFDDNGIRLGAGPITKLLIREYKLLVQKPELFTPIII